MTRQRMYPIFPSSDHQKITQQKKQTFYSLLVGLGYTQSISVYTVSRIYILLCHFIETKLLEGENYDRL